MEQANHDRVSKMEPVIFKFEKKNKLKSKFADLFLKNSPEILPTLNKNASIKPVNPRVSSRNSFLM